MQVVIIILLILAVLLVIFTLQNSMEISINVFFWEITNAPLVLVLICCILIGYIVAAVYLYPRIWKIKKEYNQLIKLNPELKELHYQNKKKKKKENNEEDVNPEGYKMNEDDDSFFKD